MNSIYLRYKTKCSATTDYNPEVNMLFTADPTYDRDRRDAYHAMYVVTKIISFNEVEAREVINTDILPYFKDEVVTFSVSRETEYFGYITKKWAKDDSDIEYYVNFGRWTKKD